MAFFGKIDRYIIRQFFSGFIFSLTLIVSISITIDFAEKIDKFLIHNLSFGVVFKEFYLNFIPYIIVLLGPYFVCITVVFFTSNLASKSEIIAFYNSGMSFLRLLFPYLFTSVIIAILFWYANNYLVPNTNKIRLAFENKYISFESALSSDNIHRRINDTTFFYFKIYDKTSKIAYNTSIETYSNHKLISKTLAEKAIWDTATKSWKFLNFFTRKNIHDKEIIEKGDEKIQKIDFDPTTLTKRWTYIEELNREELKEKIKDLKLQGVDNTAEFECELHRRDASSFGIILLSLMGVIVSSKKTRGGLGMHLMYGITISAVYEVFKKFAVSFALKANFDPMIASWTPNFIFVLICIFLYWKIIK